MATLRWSRQVPALPAAAVAARGATGRALADKATGRAGLVVDQVGEWTIVRGSDLPWVDGVVYLGAVPGAPDILVPVHRRPSAPGEILSAAIRTRVGPGPVAVIPADQFDAGSGEGVLVSLSAR